MVFHRRRLSKSLACNPWMLDSRRLLETDLRIIMVVQGGVDDAIKDEIVDVSMQKLI